MSVTIQLKITRRLQELFKVCPEGRPGLEYIYFNPQENELVATNGHILVSLPGDEYIFEVVEDSTRSTGWSDGDEGYEEGETFGKVAGQYQGLKGFTLTIPKGQKKLGQNDEVLFRFECDLEESTVDLSPCEGRHTSTVIRKGKDTGNPFAVELEHGSGSFPPYREIVDGVLKSVAKHREAGEAPMIGFNAEYVGTISSCFGQDNISFQLPGDGMMAILVRPVSKWDGREPGMKAYALLMPVRIPKEESTVTSG